MKTIYVLISCIMILIYTNIPYATPSSYQGNWEWRNDDGDVYSATWKDSLNTPVVITDNKNIRLRIDNFYPGSGSANISLGYSEKPGIAPWIPITNIDTGKFSISSSQYITDTKPYFDNQLLPSVTDYSYVKTVALDSTNNYLLIADNKSKYELEYSLKPTSKIQPGKAYFFSLFQDNNPIKVGYGSEYAVLLTSPINWSTQHSGTIHNLNDISFVDKKHGWAIGDVGIVLRTTNGGINWILKATELGYLQSVSFIDANRGWISNVGNSIIKTTNGGDIWIPQLVGEDSRIYGVFFIDENTGWAVGGDQVKGGIIYKTIDGGNTWDVQWSKSSSDYVGMIYFSDSCNGSAISGAETILSTTNGGKDWHLSESEDVLNGISVIDSNYRIAVGNGGTILKTTDGGINWFSQSSGTTRDLFGVSFIDNKNGYVVGKVGTILRTSDGGDTWTMQVSGTSIQLNAISFVCANNLIVVGNSGKILRTTTNNALPVELISFTAVSIANGVQLNWSTATELNNQGFEVQRSTDQINFETIEFIKGKGISSEQHNYSFTDKKISHGKYYYRLKQVDFNGDYKYSYVVEVNLNVPMEFSLEQNYPNPFNPTTTIKYSIPKQSFVTLKVFDVLAREVKTLVNEVKPAGIYKIKFDASNLASGVYFYRIMAGNFVQTKKMILLR